MKKLLIVLALLSLAFATSLSASARQNLWLWDMRSNAGVPVAAGTLLHVSQIVDGYGNSHTCLVDWDKHQAWVTCIFLDFSP